MSLKLIFMGTPSFALPALAALHEVGHKIVCVYSQPPRPGGRGQTERPSPVHNYAVENGMPVLTPMNLDDLAVKQTFSAIELDAVVVVAYGLILPKLVLEEPRFGCLNLHPSLLPRWRGAAPIQRAIMAGDQETGICVMQMDEGLDTGGVLARKVVPLGPCVNAGELHDELANKGAPLLLETLEKLSAGAAIIEPQPDEGVIYAAKIKKSEARIDWRRPATELDCMIRALSPFPGAWFSYAGERIKVLSSTPIDETGLPGHTLDRELTVACGDGALKLGMLQRGGRKPMEAAELIRGFLVPVGANLLNESI
jgi:methionyl-tRNA formyltransferase